MKKFLALLIIGCFIGLGVSLAYAGPYLVCDPADDVTMYELEVNGDVEPATLEQVGDQARIHHDLAGWSDGGYSVRARAGNMWGWSEWCLPLDFAKAIPSPVFGLGTEE